MQHVKLGDLTVSRIGLGCMGMSWLYPDPAHTDENSIRVIHRALDLGVTHFDTAEIYGPYLNETLVGKALKGKRDQVVIATKMGNMTGFGSERTRGLDSSPANIRYAVEGSLQRLDTDYIDLYYQHRVDPKVPMEDVIGTMAELITEGKIRHIGLSEAGITNIRKAHAVHPITALQSEYSLWTRDGDDGTLDLLRELNIGFVPYSPLSRAMLTGKIQSREQFHQGDFRITNPRFQDGAFETNLARLAEVQAVADEVGCSMAQISIAWLLHKDANWSPILGTTRIDHLEEDLAAESVVLTAEQMARLEAVTQPEGDHHGPGAGLDRG